MGASKIGTHTHTHTHIHARTHTHTTMLGSYLYVGHVQLYKSDGSFTYSPHPNQTHPTPNLLPPHPPPPPPSPPPSHTCTPQPPIPIHPPTHTCIHMHSPSDTDLTEQTWEASAVSMLGSLSVPRSMEAYESTLSMLTLDARLLLLPVFREFVRRSTVSEPVPVRARGREGALTDAGCQTPSTGLRHPSFNQCRI